MEIKTTDEIINYFDGKEISLIQQVLTQKNKAKQILDFYNKKWVAVEDIIEYCKNNTYGFKENGINNLDADELIQKLNLR